MKLRDLPHDQKLALVALLDLVTMDDGEVTEEEEAEIGHVAEELGEGVFRQLVDEAEETFENAEDLKAFLETVTEEDAREVIYGTVIEEATAKASLSRTGSDLLEWLARSWHIDVEIPLDEEELE